MVAGFERLHRQSGNLLDGGRLLAGELGCVSCHAMAEGRELVDTKRALNRHLERAVDNVLDFALAAEARSSASPEHRAIVQRMLDRAAEPRR